MRFQEAIPSPIFGGDGNDQQLPNDGIHSVEARPQNVVRAATESGSLPARQMGREIRDAFGIVAGVDDGIPAPSRRVEQIAADSQRPTSVDHHDLATRRPQGTRSEIRTGRNTKTEVASTAADGVGRCGDAANHRLHRVGLPQDVCAISVRRRAAAVVGVPAEMVGLEPRPNDDAASCGNGKNGSRAVYSSDVENGVAHRAIEDARAIENLPVPGRPAANLATTAGRVDQGWVALHATRLIPENSPHHGNDDRLGVIGRDRIEATRPHVDTANAVGVHRPDEALCDSRFGCDSTDVVELQLSDGKTVALIDKIDLESVHTVEFYRGLHWKGTISSLPWRAAVKGHTTYSIATIHASLCLSLHRVILDARVGQIVDHINGNGLDCRRENLRLTDLTGNARNKRKLKPGTSRFKGVSFHKKAQKWSAQIKAHGKKYHLGLFLNEEDAAAAYDAAAVRLFSDFAKTNSN